MADARTVERVREVLGMPIDDEDAERIAAAYALLAQAEARFSRAELHGVEPPLRAVAAPARAVDSGGEASR
jgi:hypothetical protein